MTTQITIVNHDDSKHDVELRFAGQTHVLNPGDSFTTHIWAESGMSITELPAIPERRGMGALPPDPSYIGMTAEELCNKTK